jgi:twitching motility protein PilT
MKITDLLRQVAASGASDLHLVCNCPPMVRIHGELKPFTQLSNVDGAQCAELIGQLLNPEQRQRLTQEWSVDFTFALENCRFRANIFYQRLGLEAVLRVIPNRIPGPAELMLPPAIMQIADLPNGLVLVTGPTGSGKSTTLACIIDQINERRHGNIVTIEDPIEFIYANKLCVVSQREIGQHTPDFKTALKFVLRQDPDVVLLGEMRDLETIGAALTIAETGHLVLATLHSMDAPQAIDRIIDVFPSRQQQQVRTQLAGVLKTVVAQTLLPRRDERGRVAAREIMQVTPAISNLIRQGKTHEIYSAIEMGVGEGMVTLGRAIAELVRAGLVEAADAQQALGMNGPSRNSGGGTSPARPRLGVS